MEEMLLKAARCPAPAPIDGALDADVDADVATHADGNGGAVVAAGDAVGRAILSRLRAVVLLAGSVRPNPLRRAVGRFVLELPIDAQRCVMDLWHEQLTDTAIRFGLPQIPVRVLVDRGTVLPANNTWNGRCQVQFEQDPSNYRGTGGLLRDLAAQYDPGDYLLIINAAQMLLDPLAHVAESLAGLGAEMALACRNDGSPTGIMLVRRDCLLSIPEIGFVDLNEQAMPAIAREHDVRVLRGASLEGLPIRTLGDYLDALRQHHRLAAPGSGGHGSGRGNSRVPDPFAEDWQATFSIIEPGAQVDPSAVVHDSVVLAGGRVGAGATVVRSLVCPDGVVAAGASAIDCLVGQSVPTHGRG